MKKERKIIEKNRKFIFGFILGGLIFGTVGVSAATTWLSQNVTYDNSESGMTALNVQDAIDELYNSIPAATKLIKKVVTSGDGLYKDPVEAGRYVYRGADPDNYIWLDLNGDTSKTDNETYRIMSVEADDTIKVVAQNSIGNMAWDATGNRTASGYCSSTYCNAWGSSTTTLDANGNNVTVMPREAGSTTTYALPTNEASLNTYLNTTFLNSIDSELQSKIATHTYNVGHLKYTSGQTLATDISQESAYKWRGQIALINATDYVRASLNSNCTGVNASSGCGTSNYLSNSVYEWTLSPCTYSVFGRVSVIFIIDKNNGFNMWDVDDYSNNVFPVFYLTSDIKLSGEGTSGEPYEIG